MTMTTTTTTTTTTMMMTMIIYKALYRGTCWIRLRKYCR